jgi:replicative DNA helicase
VFIHREEVYQTRQEAETSGTAGIAELIVAKQRNGPTGDVQLAWFDKYTRFENLAQRPYDDLGDMGGEVNF